MKSIAAGSIMERINAHTSVVTLLLRLLLLTVLRFILVEGGEIEGLDATSGYPCSLKDPAMDPTHEVRYGHDMVWQIPPNPKAVLLLAHGGGMESLQYFDPGPKCKQCYGMPECRTAVLESLQRRYAIISVTAYDFDSRDVSTIVKEWTTQHSLDRLPLTAWGHSAGTYLVTALIGTLPMLAIVLMCGEGDYEVESMATARSFPPTLFVDMPRDAFIPELNFTEKAEKAMAMLLSRGVEVISTSDANGVIFPWLDSHILPSSAA